MSDTKEGDEMKTGDIIEITETARVLSTTTRDADGNVRPLVIVGEHDQRFLPKVLAQRSRASR